MPIIACSADYNSKYKTNELQKDVTDIYTVFKVKVQSLFFISGIFDFDTILPAVSFEVVQLEISIIVGNCFSNNLIPITQDYLGTFSTLISVF